YPTAQCRPNGWRGDSGNAIEREGDAALFRRKRIRKNRLRHWLKATAAGALDYTSAKEERKAGCETAEKRAGSEKKNAQDEKTSSADRVRKPAADGKHDGVRYEVRGEHPSTLVITCAQTPGHVRQRHVGDTSIQDLHEGGQRDRHPDQPGIVFRPPRLLTRL